MLGKLFFFGFHGQYAGKMFIGGVKKEICDTDLLKTLLFINRCQDARGYKNSIAEKKIVFTSILFQLSALTNEN